jgi:hypothetical protein
MIRMQLTCLALILAVLAGCYDPNDHVLTPEVVKQALDLKRIDSLDSLPADGFSRLILVATIPKDADPARRTVIFTTNTGTLIGGGKTGLSVEVQADGFGNASVDLQSSQVVETAYIRAEIKGVAGILDSTSVRFIQVVPDSIIRFEVSPDSADADNATLSRFVVRVDPNIPADRRKVQVTVTGASLGSSTATTGDVPVDVTTGTAAFDIRSPNRVGVGRVIVSINGVTREESIGFRRSFPDILELDPGTFALTAGPKNNTTVTAYLRKMFGMASLGTIVEFEAVDESGNVRGVFRNQSPSNDQGVASAVLSVPDTAFSGKLTIRAWVLNTSLRDSVELLVVK